MNRNFIKYPCIYFDQNGHVGYIESSEFFGYFEKWMLDDIFTIRSVIADSVGILWKIREIINEGESGNLFLRIHNRITRNVRYKLKINADNCGYIEFSCVLKEICKSLEKGREHWINDELAAGEGGREPQGWPMQLAYFTGRIRAAKAMQELRPIFADPYAGILDRRSTES